MSLILIVSITIRLVAMGWSIALLRRMRDWRIGFLTVGLGLMAMRQILTLLTEKESWTISITGHITELPGLVVSIIAFLVVFFMERIISERKRAEKRIEKGQLLAIPWRIYFLIGSIGLIVVTMIGMSFHTGIRMNATYAPLIHASMKIKQDAALAHLWFEEIITGDRKEDIQVVWENLDQTDWHAQAMLEGGISPEGIIIPLDDAEMRQDIRNVQKNLKEFRNITHQRLASRETAGIGTEIDQHYDAVFNTFIDQADKVEARLQQIMARDLQSFQLLQVILIIASFILTMIVGIIFHMYNRRQAEDFLIIDEVNKNLEKEVVERISAEEQILRKSAVLKAINKVFQVALVCETDEQVAQTCLTVVEELTGSKFGFIGEVNQSGSFDTIALSDPGWKACRVPKSDAMKRIQKMDIRGMWGSVIRDNQSQIINDPDSYPDRVGIPEGHPPINCFLGVPLKHSGKTIGLIGLANKKSGYDLTDQQDVETLSIAFVEALMHKRAEDYIQHLQSILRAIRDINQLIVHEKNRQKLLQNACEILTQNRNYKLVWIGLVEKETKDVLPAAQSGFDEGYLKSIKVTWDDSENGQGPTGTAIKTRKPSAMRDIAGDPRFKPWKEEAMKRGYASSVAIPLIHEDRVWGVLNVYATKPDSFDEEETELLLEVGQDIAFALHIIKLEEKRKQTEKELQKRRDENTRLAVIAQERSELQDWINTFDTFVGKFDPDGRGIMFNDAPVKAGDLTRDDVVGKYFPDTKWWTHSETERNRIIECFEKANAGIPSRIETTFRRADGTPVPIIFNCQPVMDDEGKVNYITAEGKIIIEELELRNALKEEKESLENRVKERTSELVTVNEKLRAEIAERKQVQEALTKSASEWTYAMDFMEDAIYLIDMDDKVIRANQAFYKMTGRTQEETIGHDITSLLHPKGETEPCQVCVARRARRDAQITLEADHPSNPINHPIEIMVKMIRNERGKPIGVLMGIHDLFNQRKIEKELKKSYNQLRNLATHLQYVREEERTQIAREIHDELGQILTALKMDLSWMDKKLPKEQKSLSDKTKSMSNLIDSTIKTVKRISMELRPGLLDDLGLLAAIEWQAEEFQNRTGIECKVTINPENIIIDQDRSTTIFRVFQETLTNVARHAKATKVMVSLKEKSARVFLQVKDNGRGITKEEISKPGSFGILGIRERIYPWGGDVNIKGEKGKGTTISVNVPLS